jgi:hypothetical protein
MAKFLLLLALVWVDNSYDEFGFIVEKKKFGEFVEIGRTGQNITKFMLAPTAKGCWRVRAFNQTEVSAPSNVVCKKAKE